jgi:hypothetical protein
MTTKTLSRPHTPTEQTIRQTAVLGFHALSAEAIKARKDWQFLSADELAFVIEINQSVPRLGNVQIIQALWARRAAKRANGVPPFTSKYYAGPYPRGTWQREYPKFAAYNDEETARGYHHYMMGLPKTERDTMEKCNSDIWAYLADERDDYPRLEDYAA